jgi:hypothetical protein
MKNCEGCAGESNYHDCFLKELRTNEILQPEHPAAGRYMNPVLSECESDAYTIRYARVDVLTALLMRTL